MSTQIRIRHWQTIEPPDQVALDGCAEELVAGDDDGGGEEEPRGPLVEQAECPVVDTGLALPHQQLHRAGGGGQQGRHRQPSHFTLQPQSTGLLFCLLSHLRTFGAITWCKETA